ncbi:hypothetical protein O6H91_16G030700 [Diphasiastrum complanatum]|uniref:Uncharacterized protein n=1 Tax=Diphasiastrum complanatum TaxID=34168 RepID=A0ACC2BB45_DIPCM|nr:hypothetical protein O6H91_16G030700 [Diphasiastrum complanatum]
MHAYCLVKGSCWRTGVTQYLRTITITFTIGIFQKLLPEGKQVNSRPLQIFIYVVEYQLVTTPTDSSKSGTGNLKLSPLNIVCQMLCMQSSDEACVLTSPRLD